MQAVLLLLVCASPAWAEPTSEHVGDGASALPAVGGVAVPGPLHLRGDGFVSAGYGYTGAVLGTGDAHHRVAGSVAASARLVDWLAIAARFDGRYDAHSGVPNGRDAGWTGDPRLIVRASTSPARGPWLGAQVTLWAPGGEAPSLVPEATSFDFALLAALPVSRWVLAVNAGYRLDRSASALPDPDQLSRADRLAWGASDSNAILAGIGARWQASPALELLAEGRWDLLVGGDAPDPLESPLRFAAGARWSLSSRLTGLGLVEVTASRRPPIEAGAPLVPVEPRVSALVGLGISLDPAPPRPRPLVVRAPVRRAAPPPPLPPPPPEPATIRGHVTTLSGVPLPGARVRVECGGAVLDTGTDAGGAFSVAGVPAGAATVRFSADGHRDEQTTVEVRAGEHEVIDQPLAPALPAGQIRGVVSSFGGRPLHATVKVESVAIETATDDEGSFQTEVPPGEYQVIFSAPGYRTQRRRLRVEVNGVTVVNVDLREEGR